MTILTMPEPAGIKAMRFELQANTQVHVSPANKSVQTLERPGSIWLATYQYPPMKRADAAQVIAFLRKLNGRAGRFYGSDLSAIAALGVATGSPRVNGASQTGSVLLTKDWTNNTTNILKAGDYISFNVPISWRQLHQVVDDANSDGTGLATLNIAPALRRSPNDNQVVIKHGATCVMMLIDDQQGAWDINEASLYGITFSAREAFSVG